jgi:hypothetical protein
MGINEDRPRNKPENSIPLTLLFMTYPPASVIR